MAKSIDLGGLRRPKPSGDMSTPPPAQVPPGAVTRQGPPLPVGKAVVATDPKSLTDFEKGELKKISGWKEGDPIPSNMAEILAAEGAAKSELENLPLPVDPGTPAVDIDPVPIENLPPEQQAAVRKSMDDALDQAARLKADQAQAQQVAQSPQVAQTVMAAAMKQPGTEPGEAPERPATGHVPDADHEPTEEPPPDATTSGAVQAVANCPHCGWDMSMEDIPEPPRKARQKFLQSVLGQLAYTARHELMGGALTVTLRTLTSAEADACFKQTFRDRDNGEFLSEMDFWEKVNRYRLYLQIASVERRDEEPIDLPDGLNPIASPNAREFWKVSEDEEAPLKLIERHILKEVLPSESVARIVQVELGRFNRVVSKMEAMVDNADFWKPTEETS